MTGNVEKRRTTMKKKTGRTSREGVDHARSETFVEAFDTLLAPGNCDDSLKQTGVLSQRHGLRVFLERTSGWVGCAGLNAGLDTVHCEKSRMDGILFRAKERGGQAIRLSS